MIFKVEKMLGSLHECECCGMYSADGVFIFANDVLIWKKYSDGHMYGTQTENSILSVMLDSWKENNLEKIDVEFSEEARIDWNKRYPGNGVARTKESWSEYKKEKEEYIDGVVENVIKCCQQLPYDETLQIKMIALWLEENCGEEFKVLVSDVSEKKVEQEYLI